MKIDPNCKEYHRFTIGDGNHTLLDENMEVVSHGSRGTVDTVITKKLPPTCTIYYYRREADGITFVKYAKWEGKR